MVIGQEKLITKIQSTPIELFPHSLILLGKTGSGKHMLCDIISEHLGITTQVLDKIDNELINTIILNTTPMIYIINNTGITPREESVLLKLLEEPPQMVFIIVLCEDRNLLLPTILNRCQIWELENYSKDILAQFTDDSLILELAETPGQIEYLKVQNLNEIINTCNYFLDNLTLANFPSYLLLTNKINFKDDFEKYDCNTFIKVLHYCVVNRYKENKISLQVVNLTHTLVNDLNILSINKKQLFENYLCNLKRIV